MGLMYGCDIGQTDQQADRQTDKLTVPADTSICQGKTSELPSHPCNTGLTCGWDIGQTDRQTDAQTNKKTDR